MINLTERNFYDCLANGRAYKGVSIRVAGHPVVLEFTDSSMKLIEKCLKNPLEITYDEDDLFDLD